MHAIHNTAAVGLVLCHCGGVDTGPCCLNSSGALHPAGFEFRKNNALTDRFVIRQLPDLALILGVSICLDRVVTDLTDHPHSEPCGWTDRTGSRQTQIRRGVVADATHTRTHREWVFKEERGWSKHYFKAGLDHNSSRMRGNQKQHISENGCNFRKKGINVALTSGISPR